MALQQGTPDLTAVVSNALIVCSQGVLMNRHLVRADAGVCRSLYCLVRPRLMRSRLPGSIRLLVSRSPTILILESSRASAPRWPSKGGPRWSESPSIHRMPFRAAAREVREGLRFSLPMQRPARYGRVRAPSRIRTVRLPDHLARHWPSNMAGMVGAQPIPIFAFEKRGAGANEEWTLSSTITPPATTATSSYAFGSAFAYADGALAVVVY